MLEAINTLSEIAPLPQQYRAYFRNSPKKNILLEKRAIVPFSLAAPYHTGEELKAILTFIPTTGLAPENTFYVLGDGLQAYNLAMSDLSADPDDPQIRQQAHTLGDKWIEGHEEMLHDITLIRWQTFFNSPDFLTEKARFFNFHYNDTSPVAEEFRLGINKTADEVFNRFKKRNDKIIPDENRARELGVKFVLEECALFSWFSRTHNINYMAYPSILPASLDVTKKFLIRDNNLLEWLAIKIKAIENAHNTTYTEEHIVPYHNNGYDIPQRQRRGSGNNSGSESSYAGSPAAHTVPEEIKPFHAMLIGQINAFKKSLVETGTLDEKKAALLVRSVAEHFKQDDKPAPHPNSHPDHQDFIGTLQIH